MMLDLAPLSTQQNQLTDALNATFLTYNGNEGILQNDMGNTKIQDTNTGNIMGLREGFVPIGMKEHGGVLYIASVNKEGEGEIGTIPSPIIRDFLKNKQQITFDGAELSSKSGTGNKYYRISEKLYPGEKFLMSLKIETDKNTDAYSDTKKLLTFQNSKDANGNWGQNRFTIEYPYITKQTDSKRNDLDRRTLTLWNGVYDLKIFTQNISGTRESEKSLLSAQKLKEKRSSNTITSDFWFLNDSFTGENWYNPDLRAMNKGMLKSYPSNQQAGYLCTKAVLNSRFIKDFGILRRSDGMKVPFSVKKYIDSKDDIWYYTYFPGFWYTSENAAYIGKFTVSIYNETDNYDLIIYHTASKSVTGSDTKKTFTLEDVPEGDELKLQKPSQNEDEYMENKFDPVRNQFISSSDTLVTYVVSDHNTDNIDSPIEDTESGQSENLYDIEETKKNDYYKNSSRIKHGGIFWVKFEGNYNKYCILNISFENQFGEQIGNYRLKFNPYLNDTFGTNDMPDMKFANWLPMSFSIENKNLNGTVKYNGNSYSITNNKFTGTINSKSETFVALQSHIAREGLTRYYYNRYDKDPKNPDSFSKNLIYTSPQVDVQLGTNFEYTNYRPVYNANRQLKVIKSTIDYAIHDSNNKYSSQQYDKNEQYVLSSKITNGYDPNKWVVIGQNITTRDWAVPSPYDTNTFGIKTTLSITNGTTILHSLDYLNTVVFKTQGAGTGRNKYNNYIGYAQSGTKTLNISNKIPLKSSEHVIKINNKTQTSLINAGGDNNQTVTEINGYFPKVTIVYEDTISVDIPTSTLSPSASIRPYVEHQIIPEGSDEKVSAGKLFTKDKFRAVNVKKRDGFVKDIVPMNTSKRNSWGNLRVSRATVDLSEAEEKTVWCILIHANDEVDIKWGSTKDEILTLPKYMPVAVVHGKTKYEIDTKGSSFGGIDVFQWDKTAENSITNQSLIKFNHTALKLESSSTDNAIILPLMSCYRESYLQDGAPTQYMMDEVAFENELYPAPGMWFTLDADETKDANETKDKEENAMEFYVDKKKYKWTDTMTDWYYQASTSGGIGVLSNLKVVAKPVAAKAGDYNNSAIENNKFGSFWKTVIRYSSSSDSSIGI